jgi:hypothetical protein
VAAGHVVEHRVGVALDGEALWLLVVLERRVAAGPYGAVSSPASSTSADSTSPVSIGLGVGGIRLDDVGVDNLVRGRPGVHRLVDSRLRGGGLRLLATRGTADAVGATPARPPRRPVGRAPLHGGACAPAPPPTCGHDDGDVAGPLADAGGAATGAGPEATERRALVGEAGGDVELVPTLAVVVLGVGHGRCQHLADDSAHLPVGEAQYVLGPLDLEPTDEVQHLASLGGRAAQVLGGGAGADALAGDRPALVGLGTGHLLPFAFFSWPAWNRRCGWGELAQLVPDHRLGDDTGTCLRPSWTATVWPTRSGMIVERRDQVLMTRRSPAAFMVSTFLSRWSSTKGPSSGCAASVTSGPCPYGDGG